ncbi:Crp/Fnr family transcriptional regulator [Parapedobacter sp. ISTM3]|uniref:cAMP-binding domain of CRP or a regulatory subunit of cAMP-dependent protein kinases n=1 Tax=Parapedobacter luteus TaxID=623280 RepID=A0A1T5EMX7_9SPHI|nr:MULTISPECIES: Crp/Fnr family transcriptional regulator [Parapedobacter]MBK1441283.1 Crp/Fnr family transcriptional regulator [Parapedobacter sp. ISTM3]SKB85314.1 cAMP-binding domain of CRP or a regulatory subunit of cAMP-dependent protein kinases [Parapedobacter luteus]
MKIVYKLTGNCLRSTTHCNDHSGRGLQAVALKADLRQQGSFCTFKAMDNFLAALRKYVPISEEDAAYFYSFFKKKQYQRGELLLKEGEVAHEVFFVMKGALRQYFFNERGDERTCNFTFEHQFVTDLESFSRQAKSATHIIALEPAACLVLTCEDAVTCLKESPAVASLFGLIVENLATDTIRRIRSLLSKTPEEQIEELTKTNPEMLRRVPQRYIAQYLGVAPESLSRIRKRMIANQKS